MSKHEKLLNRLLSLPRDFTWEELNRILSFYGYSEVKTGKTGGSRRKFVNKELNVIILHQPHPGNIIKTYAIKQIIEHLSAKGYIKK